MEKFSNFLVRFRRAPGDKGKAILACLLLIGLLIAFHSTDAIAQASSANYQMTSGQIVSGGGGSASATYGVVGCVPLTAGGVSGGANNTISGGVVPIVFGTPVFTAIYDGALVQTVTKANRVLKVAYIAGAEQTTGAFFYRQGGATAYQSAAMTAGTGDTLVYTVAEGLLTTRGLEYYFVITQGPAAVNIGTAADPYVFVVQLTNAQGRRPALLPALSYRIIGVPIDITGSITVSSVFGDDLGTYDDKQWRLFSYNTAAATYAEYPAANNVTDGRGFWLIQRTPDFYGAAGLSRRPNRSEPGGDFFEVALDSGWNLVSNPLPFDVSWADVMLDTGGVVIGHSMAVIDDAAYWYSGTGYTQATTIPDWDGFFVMAKRPGVKMLFRYREAAKASFKPLSRFTETWSDDDWRIHLRLESGGLIDDGNFAGVMADAETGSDNYDFFEPPSAPNGPSLAFRLPDDETGLRRIDCRPPFETGAEWTFEMTPGSDRVIIVTGLNRLPESMRAVIVLGDGAIIELTEDAAIEPAESVVSGRLLVGTETYFAERMEDLLPTDYVLEQNFPNPFNPITTIRFSIPQPSHVYLIVYNILGQTVDVIVDEDLDAGHYYRMWDGNDEDGNPVASGIYFYRLEAGDCIQSRKMVLLK